MLTSLFISDLHLHPARPETMELFDHFIASEAADADQLYILGDLFEYWLGDDASRHSGYQGVIDSLASLSNSNTSVYFMHGNRDFLVGEEFASSINGSLLPDPTKIKLDTLEVLLMHGDSLCTDDLEHQQFRQLTRSPEWQQEILSKTITERQAIASQLRMNSEKGNAEKPAAIMDVNQVAVVDAMRGQRVRLLIHGHTHRMAIHELVIDDHEAFRIVLGDWYRSGNYLVHDAKGLRLFNYPENTLVAELRPESLPSLAG